MKIACLGNINANLPALEAVLSDAKRREVDMFVHVGNLIGDGPNGNEILNRLKGEKFQSILGQADTRILRYKQKQGKLGTSSQPDKWMALKARYDALSEQGRSTLQAFPAKLRLRLEMKTVLLLRENPFPPSVSAHGAEPDAASKNTAHLGDQNGHPNPPVGKQTKSDIIIWTEGGTPAARKMGAAWCLNAGSVVAETGAGPACYTILQWKPGFFQVRHYTVPYQAESAIPAAQPPQQTPSLRAAEESIAVRPEITNDASGAISAVQRLLQSCLGQEEMLAHSHQVTRLALRLFDGMQPLHQYGAAERFLLQCAALLHDIGWIVGPEGHHKTALNIITNTGLLPFGKRDRYIIGAVARYHRKSTPRPRHLYFATMEPVDRRLVIVLAAILRTADGLDRSHGSLVKDFVCLCSPEEIRLICEAGGPQGGEIVAALEKGTLLEQTFGRKLVIEWNHKQHLPAAK